MIIDLLVHPEDPEGAPVEPETLAAAARDAGLDGFVLAGSDGASLDVGPYAEAAAEVGLTVFPGTAVPTDSGLVLVLLPEGASPLTFDAEELPEAKSLIDAVDAEGGAAVALRPYDRDIAHPMGDHLFTLQGLHACEVLNGRVAEIANDLALEAASNLELPCVGTSAAQGTRGLGTAATLLRRPVDTVKALVDLVVAGDCWPLGFGTEVPRDVEPERGGRRGRSGGNAAGSSGRRRRTEDRAGRDGGPDGRRRAGRRARGGPTRVTSAPEHADRLPEDYGNRAGRDVEERGPPEDIGNRLAPGETSPYHQAVQREDDD